MLGNWVQDQDGKPLEIYHLSPSMYGNCVPGATEEQSWKINGHQGDTLDPITLTPELMEKIGWKKTIDTLSRKEFSPTGKKGDFDTVHFNYGKYDLDKPKEAFYYVKKIRFLHELQNRYRWEAGKKLIVNL